jgi:rhamnosyl/mannosyltransferase
MKILEVNKYYYPWIGGVETAVAQLAEGLNLKKDVEVQVLCCAKKDLPENEVINEVQVSRCKIWKTLFKMPISWSFFKKFKLKSSTADIVVLNHPFPLAFFAYALYRPNSHVVVHYHADIVKQKRIAILINPLLKWVLKKSKKIIVSNPNIINTSFYLEKFKEKCVTIPFGVDLEKVNCIPQEKVDRIKSLYGRKFILFAGRLAEYKGVRYLIDAVKKIDVPLVIIGEGEMSTEIENYISKLNLRHRIHVVTPQPQEELYAFFKSATTVVLPSIHKSEAFGIVLIEAMACGTPVISTELGTGTSFVNVDGQTGFVVAPRNSEQLENAILKIVNNEDTCRKLGLQAMERVKYFFSLDRVLGMYHSVFLEIMLKNK